MSDSPRDTDPSRGRVPFVRIGCRSCAIDQDIALGNDRAVAVKIRKFFDVHVDCDTTIDLSEAADWGIPSLGRATGGSRG